MATNPVQQAIEASGLNYTQVARELDLTRQRVSQMANTGRIAPEKCRLLSDLSKGAVSCHQLRPDVFGPEQKRFSSAEARDR